MANDLAIKKITATIESRTYGDRISELLPSPAARRKFIRTACHALATNPAAAEADRTSLFLAIEAAARDGLLLDGKEAALVTFNSKGGPKAAYMPMVRGLLRLATLSGKIRNVSARCVFEKEDFKVKMIDGEPEIHHTPVVIGERGELVAAYAVAHLADGSKISEVMRRDEIDQVRKASRNKDGSIWAEWLNEMARKSVVRRLFKYLPADALTPELSSAITADNDGYFDDDGADVIDAEPVAKTEPVKPSRVKETLKEAQPAAEPASGEDVGEEVPL